MAILNTSTDYSGRTVDVSVLVNPDATLVDPQEVKPSFGNPSRLCSGVQKLVQRYAILMLTNIGSQPEYPEFATAFLWSLQAGVADLITARQIFTLADYTVANIIKDYQNNTPDLPLDEQLDTTTLLDIYSQPGSAGFRIQLTTLAGTAVTYLVPLPK